MQIMTPAGLSAMQPNRLSSSRSLVNRMLAEGWTVERLRFDVDADGAGEAAYRVSAGERVFDFVVFAFATRDQERTQRIFDAGWDMMGALLDGAATDETTAHTRRELPKLYHGRATENTLTWARANRSVRVFEHVVEALAVGLQPDVEALARVGYLMRNVGLDGNGTFGTRTFLSYGDDHPLGVAYHAQMLSAYLMREFSFDLAERLAALRAPEAAVELDHAVKRYLGVGNSSALGLVLWIGNHPFLVDRWIGLREQALAHARALELEPGDPRAARLLALLRRALTYHEEDANDYTSFADAASIASELASLERQLSERLAATTAPTAVAALLDDLLEPLSVEAVEVVNAIVVELDADHADMVARDLTVQAATKRNAAMSLHALHELLRDAFGWALALDLGAPGARRNVWYKSRSAEEPRCGAADEVPPNTIDLTIDVPGLAQALDALLAQSDPAETVGSFLARHPEQRGFVERVQSLHDRPYHAAHCNLRDESLVPAQLIRLPNAAFYGLDRTKDFMLRDLRGVIFQGAPTRADLADPDPRETWFWPAIPQLGDGAETTTEEVAA